MVEHYPVRTVCGVLGVAPSSYYYQPSPDESRLKGAISELASHWPTYGYRRITAELRLASWTVNHKRVDRLMAAMGLQVKAKRVA